MAYTVNPSSGELEFKAIGGQGGIGNVVGPASSTDNAVVRWDGVTGKLIQNSNAILDDTGLLTLAVALPISSGGTGQNNKTDAFDALSPTTTKGDLIVYNGTDNIRLPVGSNNFVLTADSTQASGVKWASIASAGDVVGPASSTDNALARFDGITGKLIQNSNAILDDTGLLNLAVALPVSSGGTGVNTLTGIAVGNGTSALVGRSLTQPAAGITISNANGTSGNPTFALANDLAAVEGLATTGIAVRTGVDTWATRSIIAGSGVTITNGTGAAGNIQIDSTGTMPWTEITATSGTATINNAYILNNASLVSFALPTGGSPVGSMVRIVGKGAGGWRITQAANQVIHTPDGDTTTGTGGSLSSTNRYCCVTYVCTATNLEWTVINGYGNFTLV